MTKRVLLPSLVALVMPPPPALSPISRVHDGILDVHSCPRSRAGAAQAGQNGEGGPKPGESIFKSSNHPTALMFHLGFKIAAVVV